MSDSDERPKAQDLFAAANLVFSQKVGFGTAFPEVASASVVVTESGEGIWPGGRRAYTETTLGEYVNCSNSPCYRGGFNIGSVLRRMASTRETEASGHELCRGNEASPKGKRVYRKCMNSFRYTVTLTYKTPTSSGAPSGSAGEA